MQWNLFSFEYLILQLGCMYICTYRVLNACNQLILQGQVLFVSPSWSYARMYRSGSESYKIPMRALAKDHCSLFTWRSFLPGAPSFLISSTPFHDRRVLLALSRHSDTFLRNLLTPRFLHIPLSEHDHDIGPSCGPCRQVLGLDSSL